MRKSLKDCSIILLLSILPILSFSQTAELEEESMFNRVQNGEITGLEYNELISEWKSLLMDVGGYPELPYIEESQKMDFTTIFSFEGLPKEVIYNRIIEWSAISFGAISEVLHYSNLETGKIILKGNFDFIYRDYVYNFWGVRKEGLESLEEAKSYQTWVFTIVDEGLKIETFNIRYSIVYYQLTANYTSPRRISESSNFESLYPITSTEPKLWKSRLSILKTTSNEFARIYESIKQYVSSYEGDYNFLDH